MNNSIQNQLKWLSFVVSQSRHRVLRKVVLKILYTLGLVLSYLLACELRFDFKVDNESQLHLLSFLPYVVGFKLILLLVYGQFEGLLSYFSLPDLSRLFRASFLYLTTMLAIWVASHGVWAPPRGIILSDCVLSFLGLAAIRLGFRLLRERYLAPHSNVNPLSRRVAIVGAGDVGARLVSDLFSKRGLGLMPVAIFDDDPKKWNAQIHGVTVLGSPKMILDKKEALGLEQVIIAMPSAPAKRIGEVVKLLQPSHLQITTVPGMDQLATGQVQVSQIRPVEIQDLLGREPVVLETDNIRSLMHQRRILVTGAGGSIGSELCRQIAAFGPELLLLVEQCEVQLFTIEQELIRLGFAGCIVPLVADILDKPRMEWIFQQYRPHILFHAAAHKHVPMMERQPSEAITNNFVGTARTAELALAHGVERFVLVSTDKAVNPTSAMGATKRLAEIYLQSLSKANPNKTHFMAVRFGNVLGSSGSVVPTFTRQIAAGGPVTVTHPEMVRYFMTIPEAVALVLQCSAQGHGGEIFVLDMGKPVKIADLARQMIELSGLKPDVDIELKFVGLRPGEKMFEELNLQGEAYHPTRHGRIMRFVAGDKRAENITDLWRQLDDKLHRASPDELKLLIKQYVPEYTPDLDSHDEATVGVIPKAETSQRPRRQFPVPNLANLPT